MPIKAVTGAPQNCGQRRRRGRHPPQQSLRLGGLSTPKGIFSGGSVALCGRKGEKGGGLTLISAPDFHHHQDSELSDPPHPAFQSVPTFTPSDALHLLEF